MPLLVFSSDAVHELRNYAAKYAGRSAAEGPIGASEGFIPLLIISSMHYQWPEYMSLRYTSPTVEPVQLASLQELNAGGNGFASSHNIELCCRDG